jgi:hypothetical protein
MKVPDSAVGPILADCITYGAELWTIDPWSSIATSVYDSLEKAMSGCEEQIRKYLEAKINKLEAELADRPVVFAIQHIDTKILAERGYKSVSMRGTTSAESSASVDLYRSGGEAAIAILREFFDPEHWKVVAYTGRLI